MRRDTRLLRELLEEVRETHRLIQDLHQTLSSMMKRMLPAAQNTETITKGGPMAEITVRSPEKLEQWRHLFESRGLRVEYYEPHRADGEGYFAKLWGYLERSSRASDTDPGDPS
ncbi:MAG: hypothetical protein ACE5LV_07865 [Candidatus Aminicenantales bacterium]